MDECSILVLKLTNDTLGHRVRKPESDEVDTFFGRPMRQVVANAPRYAVIHEQHFIGTDANLCVASISNGRMLVLKFRSNQPDINRGPAFAHLEVDAAHRAEVIGSLGPQTKKGLIG